MNTYAERTAALAASLAAGSDRSVALAKHTSNLFRDRARAQRQKLDVRHFNHVLAVDADQGWVDVEGMTPYESLVEATLAHGAMPAVVPELKTITIGGAVAGVGIEATSFRHGLVHETVREIDVLCADGKVRTCSPTNEHADLFFGFPNSYGTLGYALRVRAATLRTAPFVEVTHQKFDDAAGFFAAIAAARESDCDFLDGVVFDRRTLVVNRARFVDEAPATSDYTFEQIYYRSLLDKPVDYLRTADYIWRWDTDWFWCSKNVYAQVPLIRRLYGRDRLNSRTYTKIMKWNARVGLTRRLERLSGWHSESVIQDVDIPIDRGAEFLAFFLDEIGIAPIWVCPIQPGPRAREFVLFPMDSSRFYVNFGFWDVKRTREAHPAGHFNRLIEAKVAALGGIKSLYSDSYYSRDAFDRAFGGEAYRALKAKYDPEGRFPALYDKCVLRH